MTKPGKPPGSRKRHLSEEDADVWSYTARTLKPLKKAKARIHNATEALELLEPRAFSKAVSPKSETLVPAVASPKASAQRPAAERVKVPSKAPELADFDKRKARKLGSGQIAIDARIDLHGMRQGEAHTALRRFLFASFNQGHRWVLVVTGKGARQNRDREQDPWTIVPVKPGVLKRSVPAWLGEPELRAIVISFKLAASRHGGEGALYVHLRNAERAGRW